MAPKKSKSTPAASKKPAAAAAARATKKKAPAQTPKKPRASSKKAKSDTDVSTTSAENAARVATPAPDPNIQVSARELRNRRRQEIKDAQEASNNAGSRGGRGAGGATTPAKKKAAEKGKGKEKVVEIDDQRDESESQARSAKTPVKKQVKRGKGKAVVTDDFDEGGPTAHGVRGKSPATTTAPTTTTPTRSPGDKLTRLTKSRSPIVGPSSVVGPSNARGPSTATPTRSTVTPTRSPRGPTTTQSRKNTPSPRQAGNMSQSFGSPKAERVRNNIADMGRRNVAGPSGVRKLKPIGRKTERPSSLRDADKMLWGPRDALKFLAVPASEGNAETAVTDDDEIDQDFDDLENEQTNDSPRMGAPQQPEGTHSSLLDIADLVSLSPSSSVSTTSWTGSSGSEDDNDDDGISNTCLGFLRYFGLNFGQDKPEFTRPRPQIRRGTPSATTRGNRVEGARVMKRQRQHGRHKRPIDLNRDLQPVSKPDIASWRKSVSPPSGSPGRSGAVTIKTPSPQRVRQVVTSPITSPNVMTTSGTRESPEGEDIYYDSRTSPEYIQNIEPSDDSDIPMIVEDFSTDNDSLDAEHSEDSRPSKSNNGSGSFKVSPKRKRDHQDEDDQDDSFDDPRHDDGGGSRIRRGNSKLSPKRKRDNQDEDDEDDALDNPRHDDGGRSRIRRDNSKQNAGTFNSRPKKQARFGPSPVTDIRIFTPPDTQSPPDQRPTSKSRTPPRSPTPRRVIVKRPQPRAERGFWSRLLDYIPIPRRFRTPEVIEIYIPPRQRYPPSNTGNLSVRNRPLRSTSHAVSGSDRSRSQLPSLIDSQRSTRGGPFGGITRPTSSNLPGLDNRRRRGRGREFLLGRTTSTRTVPINPTPLPYNRVRDIRESRRPLNKNKKPPHLRSSRGPGPSPLGSSTSASESATDTDNSNGSFTDSDDSLYTPVTRQITYLPQHPNTTPSSTTQQPSQQATVETATETSSTISSLYSDLEEYTPTHTLSPNLSYTPQPPTPTPLPRPSSFPAPQNQTRAQLVPRSVADEQQIRRSPFAELIPSAPTRRIGPGRTSERGEGREEGDPTGWREVLVKEGWTDVVERKEREE